MMNATVYVTGHIAYDQQELGRQTANRSDALATS